MITRADLFERLRTGAYWGAGVTFKRSNPVPIDMTSVFKSLDEARAYAIAEDNVAYPGQTIAVIDDTNNVTLYIVQPKSEGVTTETILQEVGKTILGDGVSVEVENDKVKLKGFGKGYYSNTGEFKEGWTQGLEPKVKLEEDGSFSLAWYEPSTTTAEGVASTVATLSQTVGTLSESVGTAQNDIRNLQNADSELDGRLDTIEDDLNTTGTGLKAVVAEHTTDIAAIEAKFADYSTTEQVDSKINTAIAGLTHFDKKVVTADTREAAIAQMTDANTLYLYKATEEADAYEEYIVIDGVATMIGDTSTDLQDYAKTADVTTAIGVATKNLVDQGTLQASVAQINAKFEDYDTSTEVSNKITAATTGMATTGYVDGKVEELATAAGELNDTVAEHTTTIGGHTTKLAELESELDSKATQADLATANGKIATLQGDVETINNTIANLGSTYATDTELDQRAGAIESEVAKKADATTVVSDIATAKAEAISTANDATNAAIAGALNSYTNTEALNALLANKVDKQTSEYNGQQVAWTLVSPEDQAKLAKLTLGETGNLEVSGKVNADNVEGLATWITKSRNDVTGLFSEQLASDLATALTGANQAIKAIELGGVNVTVESNVAKIGVASSTLGVVKSTDADNGISVAADGTMSVNSIKTSKLVDDAESPLVLFGGKA